MHSSANLTRAVPPPPVLRGRAHGLDVADEGALQVQDQQARQPIAVARHVRASRRVLALTGDPQKLPTSAAALIDRTLDHLRRRDKIPRPPPRSLCPPPLEIRPARGIQAARKGRRGSPSSVSKPPRGLGRSRHQGTRRQLAFQAAEEPGPEPQPGRPDLRRGPRRRHPEKEVNRSPALFPLGHAATPEGAPGAESRVDSRGPTTL
jgi:hypothetical protein